jgi:homoserine O-acetyltransferase
VAEWWPGMVGPGLLFDTDRYFVVCANILGSCYGSTGPMSVNPDTGRPWYRTFPLMTFRDVVEGLELVRRHLGIEKIRMIIGGSIGAQQALEYSIMYPGLIQRLAFLASSVQYAPWGIAFSQSMRLAIEADATFEQDIPGGGSKGLRAARSIALLSYRNDTIYNKTQQDDDDRLTDFRAVSYQNYQGDKLVRRFDAYTYYHLLRLSDTHNVGRGRGGKKKALSLIKARVLSVGISSDLLFPTYEQKFLAENVEGGTYREIDSLYGHDGFLVETEKLTEVVRPFLEEE